MYSRTLTLIPVDQCFIKNYSTVLLVQTYTEKGIFNQCAEVYNFIIVPYY